MKNIFIAAFILALTLGCTSNKKTADSSEKYPAFDLKNMDTTIKPGDDFFAYVNGTWQKNNPIPPDLV